MPEGTREGKAGETPEACAPSRQSGYTGACKISPGIACIPLPDDRRQNAYIKERRGGAWLHSMTEMQGFGPFSVTLLMGCTRAGMRRDACSHIPTGVR